MLSIESRLRKHADYQRVYGASRKQFGKQMNYFAAARPLLGADGKPLRVAGVGVVATGPRVGLTVGKVMGKAVDRNRIKRRMREAVRKNLPLLSGPVDVILHPRKSVKDLEFGQLEREVAAVFKAIRRVQAEWALERQRKNAGGAEVCAVDAVKSVRDRVSAAGYAVYKAVVSPVLHAVSPSRCVYLPTCSEYAYTAVSRFGWVRGSWMAARRVARCHPFAKGGLDPVPMRAEPIPGPERLS